jgi:NCAIR mutase (PurE)-related protein
LDEAKLRELLGAFKRGDMNEDQLLSDLKFLPFESLGFAQIDHHRSLRTGFPEVVFGQGKSDEQILAISESIIKKGVNFLVTRIGAETGSLLLKKYENGIYYEDGRVFSLEVNPRPKHGYVLVITAGTSDIPVAEEAAVTASLFGCNVDRVYDVGVAGVHRLIAYRSMIEAADIIIVAAGMEGALASVVASISKAPVVALPTSIGYGASFKGLAALLGMMNSCSPGVSVVNIDNGFGAGCTAALMCARAVELAKNIQND